MPLHAARPKILGFINEDVSAWLVALLALLAGGVLTGLLAWTALNTHQQQVAQRFQLLASERKSRIAERFADQEQRLDSLRRFFLNSSAVSREEFDGYTHPLLQRAQAYGWAPLITNDQRAAFEREVRQQGLDDFSILDLDPAGGTHVALDKARELGGMVVSQPLQLRGVAAEFGSGALLAAPVMRQAATADGSPAEQANRSAITSLVIMGGLLSLLLSALLYTLVSQRQRALSLVEQRTRELRGREQELRSAHAQLRGVLDAATQVAVIATDLRGVITTFNAGAEHMLGYPGSEVLGHVTLESLHLPRELEERAAELSLRYGKPVPACQAMLVPDAKELAHEPREWTLVRRDGSHLMVNMLATAVLDDQGLWVGHLAICIDITERKRVHEALAARDLLLKKLSAHVPGGIYQFKMAADGRFSVIYASDGIRDIYELDPQALLENAEVIFERIHPLDVSRVRASIRTSSQRLSPWREEYRVLLPVRGLRWVRGEATPEELPGGGVLWHGYISDVSDMKRVEEELRALSVTDALTGIHNRRYFQERLTLEMARVSRGNGELAVIMLDIDHFKRINDRYGHAAGDRVLQAVCQRIAQRLRCTDVFCRLGGEEFMVLCPDTGGQHAYHLAIELWQSLRSTPIDGLGTVTGSFGIASWRPGEGADALLLRADSGVYAAKQAGRDRVVEELR